MNDRDKIQFMNLSNKYSVAKNLWTTNSLKYMAHVKDALNNLDLENINFEDAVKVCQVVNTNAFDNGVCLKISRFNHSCFANAEHFWNEDLKTRDVRAIKNIKEGEEICLNYQASSSYLTRAERQKNILELFHFSCHCVACDLPEQERNQLDIKCVRYKELVNKVNMYQMGFEETAGEAFELLCDKVLICLKEMYKLAKDMKIVTRLSIIEEILHNGYAVSVSGVRESKCVKRKANFSNDIKTFYNVGLKLATILFGETYSETQVWNKRRNWLLKSE